MIIPFLPSSQVKAAKLLAALAFAGLAQQGMAAGPAANALPTGGKVVAGSATIAQSGNTMNINQSTQRAVINWNSFDVGSQATVNFNQPNAQAATLNYVNSASKSMINGAVNANGQVIFVNNNGIVFGKGAQVNVGGMVATTMNTSAKEFMDGKDIQTYEGGNSNGKIINKGNITGNNINSYIALMAPQVKNTGVITATLGGNNAVALVAGEKVSLTFSNSQLVSVSVDASVVNALISNKLLINAGNGQVIIAANSAQDLMGSVIKNTGSISANGISTAGGKISLTADTIEHSGVIEANSSQAAGGNISLKGNNITLASGSKTTATGATAGGNINVGVNNTSTQSVQNAIDNNHLANTVSVQSNATVDASATQSGNGGTINIWSKLSTMIAGALSAKGGVQGGNGGFIETSSKGNVTIAGSAVIDTSAPKGKTGQWTVDPMTLIIDSTAASVISNALNTTNVTLDATRSNSSACAFGSCTNSQSALIRIMAGADIYSSNTATSLNLIATGGQIDINSNITAGQVYAVAQAINVNGSINTNGGNNSNIYLAGAIINILGNINSNGSNSNNSNNTNSSNLNSANTTTANNRRNGQNGLNADSNTYTSNGGLINILATGDINIGSNSYISANGINGGIITIVSTAGKTTINGIVDSIGKATNGGNIAIVGKTQTDIVAALIGSEGVSQGGVINLGQVNNLGNGTILAPPATAPPALTNFVNTALAAAVDSNNSITSSNINLDSQTGINAPNGTIVVFGDQIQINNSSLAAINGDIAIGRPSYSQGAVASLVAISNSTLTANCVETSGDLLGTQNTAVVSNEWLLDPTTVTITAAASTGGTLASALAATGASNISTADIVAAINAGNTVNVVATGAITQAGALAFAPATGITGTLILDNHLTQGSSITSSGGITSSGAGTVNLQFLAGGQSLVSGAITASSGPINVVMQSYWQANTTNAGSGANVINTAPITTRGGYVIMDGTGGNIDLVHQTITMGTVNVGYLQNIYPQASINTTTNAGVVSATSTGGNFIGAGYDAVSGGTMGAYQSSGATLNIGGFVNIQAKSAGTNQYGYVISGYGAGPINAAGNITITANSSSTGIVGQDIYLSAGTTLTSYTGSVNISNNSTGNGSGLTTNAAISAATGITINNTNVGAIGVWSDVDGTLTTTAGTISITSTSTGSGVYAESLAGLITAPKVTITGTNSTAGGLGASVTGGVTITNVAGTYTSVGDALNITTTVGTNGTTGGINVTTGAITNNSNGGDVLFQSNGAITQTGGLTLAANTTTHAQNVKYDTTSGNGGSAITIGAITSQGASISAPVNVTVVATGAITQTGAWAFAPATGITDTLILDNHLTQGSSITSSGGITSSGAGTVNLQFLAGGQSLVSGAITASSGPINVVMQSYWQANTTNAGSGANVINTAPITTRGGYVIMDGTGGNIDLVHQTITMGTVNVGYLQNIYPQASINTTTNAGVVSATSTGGNFIGAGYDAVSGGTMGAYESLGATLNIGGFVNIQAKSAGTNQYGYVISAYGAGPINAAGNITITANSSSTGIVGQDIYLSAGTTLTSYTGSVNISNNSTGNGSGLTINAAISAATGITINNTNVGAIGVWSDVDGTLTTTAGTISITSTSTGSGVYAESLAGLITAPKVTITGTNSTAGGLGASVTGGVTITNVAGTYTSVGDALNITTTVGTNGTTGGINVTTGAITNNSNGGDVLFQSNGDITATSAVSFATANTTNHVQTLTYDTRTGNLNSQITTGTFTYNATGATQKVNYVEESNGSNLTIGATSVSGYMTVDNTCPSCTTVLTPASTATLMTTAAAITVSGALSAGDYISLNGLNNSATLAAVALGTSTLTVTSASTATTAISVIGNHNTANIGNPGIASTGAITDNANGGGILFKSNGNISQTGAVTVAANTSGTTSSITYDTTTGNLNSSITPGALTLTGGVSASNTAINYIQKASGAPIAVSAISMPGFILLDNTYGCTGSACTPVSGFINQTNLATLATKTQAGVSLNGTLSSGLYAGPQAITINGITAAPSSITYPNGVNGLAAASLSATTGDINITGQSAFSGGISMRAGMTASSGNINIFGVETGYSGLTAGDYGVSWSGTGSMTATGNITISGSILSAENTGSGVYMAGNAVIPMISAGGYLAINGYNSSTSTTLAGNGIYLGGAATLYLKSGGNTTLSATNLSTDGSTYGMQLDRLATNVGGNLTLQGATLSSVTNSSGAVITNVATEAPGTSASGATGIAVLLAPLSVTDGTQTIRGITAVGNVSISARGTVLSGYTDTGNTITTQNGNVSITASATSSGQVAILNNAGAVINSGGSVSLTGTSTTGNSITNVAAITAVTGVTITGTGNLGVSDGTAGAISNTALITNTGAGGVTVTSTGNTSVGAINDSGSGGISITGGRSVAAGTTTGGTITAVGTLVNTGGGVISLSMAQPTSLTGGGIESAAGITTTNASTSSNVSYGNIGGVMGAVNAATVNSVNYRSLAQGISVTLKASYTAPYGTAYNSVFATDWLQNPTNATVTVSGVANFGAPSITAAQAQASLIFASAIGGNSNLVQTGTNLDGTTNILSSLGKTVTTTGAGNTYNITPKVLTITGTQLSSTYNGVSTYETVANAGYTISGLVTNFNTGTVASPVTGAATGDAVSSVTHVVNLGASTMMNSAVAQACSTANCYTDAVSSALGTGLSNYAISYGSGTFNIAKVALSITQANTNLQYTGSAQTVTPTYSVSGLVGSDAVSSLTTNTQTGTANGVYTGTISGANGTGLSNYTITYNPGTLTISSKQTITITALADAKVYGNAVTTTNSLTYNSSGILSLTGLALGNGTFTSCGCSISGLTGSATISALTLTSLGGVTSAGVGAGAGTGGAYSIIPLAASTSLSNIAWNFVPALLTVTPRSITIAATPITTTYGTSVSVPQTAPAGYAVSSGTVVTGDTISSVAVNYYNGSTNSTTVPGSTGAAAYTGAIIPSAATGTGGFNTTNYNITYTPANLVVNKLAVTITANAQSTPYGTALALGTTAFTSSISSLPNGDTITGATLQYNSSATVPGTTNATTYTNGIVASSASGTGGFGTSNYAITYAAGNLTVTPANVVITPVDLSAAGQSVVYNGATRTFNPTTGFTVTGLQNGQTPVFGTTGLASGLNVGTYANNITSAIIASLSNGGSLSNYNITVGSQGSLTITPASLTVTGATTSLAYNGASQSNALPSVVGLVGIDLVVGNGVTVSGKSSGTNAGTYNDALSVAAAGATQLSNYSITKTNGALTITRLAATITGATTVNAYTSALQTNTYTTSGILAGDLASASAISIGGVATATHVSQGTVPDVFAVTGTAANNYNFTYVPGSITLIPVALSVTGANTTAVYNKTTQTNSAATVSGLKGSDAATIGGSYGSGINVGVYTDALSVSLSNPSDYTVGVTNGSHTITPAIITVNGITAQNKVYDATTAATLNVGTISTSGVLAGDAVTLNTSSLSGVFADKNVGNGKTVLISGVVLAGASSSNYQLSGGANTTTTANITPAPLSITGNNLTTTYNGSTQSLVAPTVTGLIAGDNVIASGNATGTNAGTYTATYTAAGVDAGNYTIISNAPVLTINKASLVVTANNAAKIYGQADPTLTATVSGLQGSDTSSVISPTYTLIRAAGSDAGPYAITAAGPSAVTNYNITYAPAVFTIARAGSLLINMNTATTTYGTAGTPTIASVQYVNGSGVLTNFTNTSGNIYTDGISTTITITPSITGATVASNVGAYANAVTGAVTSGSTANYTAVTTIANTLNITPAPLALTVANVSKTYNANAVTAAQIIAGSLTGGTSSGVTVTSGSLMNSQTIAGLGGLTFSGSAIGAINASGSTYPLNASVGSGFSNYNVTITNGTLTVNTAPLVVNGAVTQATYNGALQTNAAASISGLKGSDSVVVTGYATGTHAGTTADSLLASGAAASNYSITYNNGALTINPAALLVTGTNNQYAYNGALQTNTGASVSGLKGSDTATVAGYASATHVAQGIVPDVLVATVSSPADYTVTYVQGSLQITPIVITAAVNTATVMYNAASQTTGFVVTGLKGADTATAASGTATGTNVGTYNSNLVLITSSDYTVGAITNGTLTITPAPLTISGGLTANNKVYDTINAATIGVTGNQTLAGVLGTDAVTVSSTGPYTGATFTQSNVGSGLTVTPATTSSVINGASYTTMAGVTLGGAAAGNYYVAGVGPQTLTANITPAPLTISSGLTANNKAYDGTTAATISSATQTLAGVIASDVGNVAISSSGPYTGEFSQSNVGTGLAVSASTTPTTIAGGTYNAMTGVTLSGSAQGNYYVAGLSTPITANITPYVINFGSGSGPNIAAVANNKVYTSTTAANGSLSMVNLFGTDSVSVSYSGATFANPNVANGIAVTFAGATLSGASAANYSIGNTPITAPANITPASLTITAVDKASFYTQALTALTSAPAVGLLGSDTVTGATITTTATTTGANSAVGAYPISISAATGSGLSNYSITYVPATYTIVGPGGLVISTGGVTTPYGTGTSGTLIAPAQPTASYTTGGSNISNLTFVSATPSGSAVSYVFVDATGHNVSFDLSPSNTSTSTSGNIVVGSYPYAASNLSAVSTGLTSAIPSGNFTVTPLAVTITAPASSTVYNGSIQNQSSPTVSPAILSTGTGTDQVNIAGSASGKNVGIYGSNLTVSGADSSNYAFTLINNNLTITPYILGSGGAGTPALSATANNKVYDTTTAATGAVSLTNVFAGDAVTAGYSSATFTGATGANVHNGTTVTFNGVTLAGPDAANYAVGTAPITATANITPAPLTISAGLTANNKVYDTTNAATIAVTGNQTLAGVLGTDAVTVSSTGSYSGATFSQLNVGAGLTVTPATSVVNGLTTMTGVTLTGAAAGNYYVAGVGPQTLTANITPAPLTINAGLTANNKAYDGTTAATISSASQVLAGVLGSDVVSVSSSGPYNATFASKNVANGITVTPNTTPTVIAGGTYNAMSGVTLTGGAASNYYVTGITSPITANITPYIINFGSGTGPNITAVADSKVYTSTNTANGALSMVNLFPGDSVAVSYATATFASPNVANGITVTFNTPTLSGASAANYSIGSTAITAPANITPAPLTITAVNKSSFYSQSLATLTQAPAVGLLGSDTVTGATISTTASTTGVNASAGAYPIAISAATGSGIGNYSITYIPATYTIVAPGALMITTAGATTPYGTSTSGNIITPAQPVASYSTGGSNISALTFVSAATVGNVTSYVYRDATSALVSFNLIPTGTTTSTSENIVVGSYAYAASNLVSASSGLTSGSAITSGNLTVTPLAVTITAPTTAALTYNGQVQTQGPAVASPAILTNDLVTVSGAASGKNVGVYGSNLAVSGVDASNYTFTLVNKNITITPYAVTPGSTTGPRLTTAANNKVYDTTTAATGSLAMAGLFPGDSVAVNYSTAAFASANVNLPASPQTVAFSGVTLSGASASNYSIASGAITATANITPAPVTISGLVANNKVYTSTTADVISGAPIVTGLLGSDTSTATGTAVGTFASPNVANGISVSADLTGMTLSNGNYVITGLTAPLAANITPAPLTISSGLFAQNKVYDTTTAGIIAAIGTQTLAGVLGSDAANLAVSSSGPYTGSFSQASIGNGLTVSQATVTTLINGQSYTTMAGVTLSGSAAGNYYVTGPTTALTANITKAPLTITAINQASFVTQPIGALTYASIGLLGSDTISAVTLATAASNIQPAGQYAITASNATGAAIGNYQVTYAPGTYTIVPAGQLLIQSSGAVTPYTTAATFANPTVAYAASSGAVINNLYLTASSTVNGITTYTYSDGAGASLSFNFAPKNPVISGSNNVSVGTYGLSAANFVITGNNITNISPVVTGDLTVTPRAITIIATPATYVYNGTVRVLANNAATAGIVAGDLVTVADLTGGKNVGNYFSALTTTGVDAKNYQASFVNANLKITPYVLGSGVGGPAISATANNKVYNSTTDATGSLAMTGLFPGDVVAVNFTSAAFANPSVNNGVTVTFNGITLSGAAAANYVLGTAPVTASANITAPPQTINSMTVVQQVSTPPLTYVTPQEQRVFDNKGDILYVRDRDDMGSYFQAITVPPSGTFRFPLPNQLLQSLIDMTGINNGVNTQGYKYLLLTDGATLSVSAVDGNELPKGVTYNPSSRAFTVANLAEVSLPISVKVTIKRQGKVVSEKILEVTK
ncbi:filamentous hemagglutinin N-terminal domain-containing protein [Polynucleobacter paneuropaeus]|nr:filamentous hemagglutinin N-terminal domain-containing protein [Polynucleobacter paneuropaeus]